jgi:glyoxylase-like metal-dependent hydrolase (beta-lactamase superfamily II)
MMTGPGTNTYLFGTREVAVVDPGPNIDRHLDRIQSEAPDIRWILVTHTHPDHSPAAAVLAKRTGAELIGRPPPKTAHQDQSFQPDRIVGTGDQLVTDEFCLDVIETPGHASNHVCYLHQDTGWLVTGDHVIEGSTVVINPPDGNMRDYLRSLERARDLNSRALLPGHGHLIERPRELIDWIISHRLQREVSVALALSANPDSNARDLVPIVYRDVPEHLYEWAERSLLAHLIKLVEDGAAECEAGRYRAL